MGSSGSPEVQEYLSTVSGTMARESGVGAGANSASRVWRRLGSGKV